MVFSNLQRDTLIIMKAILESRINSRVDELLSEIDNSNTNAFLKGKVSELKDMLAEIESEISTR